MQWNCNGAGRLNDFIQGRPVISWEIAKGCIPNRGSILF